MAVHGRFLPAFWDALRPNLQTKGFEDAADDVRRQAVAAASLLGRLGIAHTTMLGESQAFHVRRALDLYHYVNPKLLVLTSAVHLALSGETVGGSGAGGALLVLGEPPRMLPMEMEDEDPDDPRLQQLFDDIRATLGVAQVNTDYRTLALWPEYLQAAWNALKPIADSEAHRQAADALRETSRQLARGLPHRFAMHRDHVEALGKDPGEIVETTAQFERLLPGLILNVCLVRPAAEGEPRIAGVPARRPGRRIVNHRSVNHFTVSALNCWK